MRLTGVNVPRQCVDGGLFEGHPHWHATIASLECAGVLDGLNHLSS